MLRALTGIDLFPPAPGACHADDVLMMFGNGAAPHSPISSGEDAAVVDHIWHAWANFARNLDPTPETTRREDDDFVWER